MQVAILCGGLATRLRPLTGRIPKSMIEIKGKPFLEHQIALLKENGLTDVVLCVGYLADSIKSYFDTGKAFGVAIQYSEEEEPLGTGGALKKAKGMLEDEFFVLYGDSYLLVDYQAVWRHFERLNKLALMTVYKNCGRIEPSTVRVQNDVVVKFDKHAPELGMMYMEYGLNIFKKEVLGLVRKNAFPIGDYFNALIERGELMALEMGRRFYEIGSRQGLLETRRVIRKAGR